MFNLLGAEENQIGNIILMAVLLVLLVGYIIYGLTSRKKNQEKAMQMLNELKQGDKIVTNAGIYGEIVSMRETNMGKVVTIKTGDEDAKRISYITINASVILGVDEKKDLILDKDGNVIDDEEEKEEQTKDDKIMDENYIKTKGEVKKEVSKTKQETLTTEEKQENNEIIKKVKSTKK